MPTSPGDNARELPVGGAPIPDVQITEPSARTRRLFPDTPAEAILTPSTRQAMRRAAADLESPGELIELGSATFLDRPLGATRRAGEADRTPLLSYDAFSARLAVARLKELHSAGFMTDAQYDSLTARARAHRPAGWPVAKLPGHARQGVVSLEDAKKVGFDFVFTRTTRSSLDSLLAGYDFSALNAASPNTYQWMASARDVLLIRTDRATLAAFDAQQRMQFRLEMPDPARFFECGGIEYIEGLSAILANGERLPIPPRLNE
jgi:hypothetical protein